MKTHRLFDSTYKMMGQGLNISSFRNNLISSNVANVDTIYYKPRDLDFNKSLKLAMEGPPEYGRVALTHSGHMQRDPSFDPLSASIYDNSDTYHLDSVDIDEQMSNLVENNIKYRTTAEMMMRKMSILKQSIMEGGN